MSLAALNAAYLADNPVGYWPMQDASGNVVDMSGNGLDLTPLAGGVAIDYQATTGPASDSTSIFLHPGGFSRSQISTATDNLTLEIWANVDDIIGDNKNVIGQNDAGGTNGYNNLMYASLRPRGICQGVNFLNQASGAVVQDAWTHVVLRRSSGTWRYFLDGVIDATSGGTDTPNAPSGALFQIGSTDANFAWRVSFAAFYNTALSDQRIADHYAAADAPDPVVVTTELQFGIGGRGAA